MRARYYDCGVDDARLTLVTLLSAHEHGAVIANYAEAVQLIKEGGKTRGVVVRDVLTGDEISVSGRVVITALGPWTDSILKMDDPAGKTAHAAHQGRALARPAQPSGI